MSARRREERRVVVLAAVLLLAAAVVWWWSNREDDALRADALAGLPPFPSVIDSGTRWREVVDAGALPVLVAPSERDRLAAFALAPADELAVIQVNALFNTPLMARLRECLPETGPSDAGWLDFTRDVDRVALISTGVALSGTFDSKTAERAAAEWHDVTRSRYRDAEVFSDPKQGCVAQSGSLLLFGGPTGCAALIDRALDSPAPAKANREALESDIYTRTNFSALRGAVADMPQNERFMPVLDAMEQMTLRANVWNDVALSVDGVERKGHRNDFNTLSALTSLSVEAAKTEYADDPAWAALLAKANVVSTANNLHLDLALPAETLLQHLSLPCPKPDAGW